jgi:predicted TPR repeat methyltransferase
LNPAILLSPVENGYLAYDPVADRLHELNPLAALIVELSDGSRSVEDIRALTGPLLPPDMTHEIDRCIADAIEHGILTRQGAGGPEQQELSASDLSDLAERLRDKGQNKTAFLCRRRVAELTPDEPKAWNALGEIAHIVGRRADARDAYEHYLALKPGDPEIEHLLIALRDEAPPARVPDACIQQLYRRFSNFFEENVCDELGYRGPEHLQGLLDPELGERTGLKILDLGCGTGLSGMRLKPRAHHMTGVDLSPEMIALAQARAIYDTLEVSEVTDWLHRHRDQRFDLVTTCDCLIYFGDLKAVMDGVAQVLVPGGVFALTTEEGAQPGFTLTDSGRYTHHPDHVRARAAEAGLTVARIETGFLRREYGADVTGLFAVLRN